MIKISKHEYFKGKLLHMTHLLYVRRVVSQQIKAVQNQTTVSTNIFPQPGHKTARPNIDK